MESVVRGIVLHSLKYGDNGLIIKVLAPNGIFSFFIGSYIKNNKNKYPFLSYPLAIVDCTYHKTKMGKLPKIKSISLVYVPKISGYDFRRQAISTFMAECAYKFIKEETFSPNIYSFLENSIHFANETEHLHAAYPIQFGFKMAALLGFNIQNADKEKTNKLFSIEKGFSLDSKADLDFNDSCFLEEIISYDINQQIDLKIPSSSLKNIFNVLLRFLKYHFPEISTLKSPEILHNIIE